MELLPQAPPKEVIVAPPAPPAYLKLTVPSKPKVAIAPSPKQITTLPIAVIANVTLKPVSTIFDRDIADVNEIATALLPVNAEEIEDEEIRPLTKDDKELLSVLGGEDEDLVKILSTDHNK